MINKILDQCRGHMKTQCESTPQGYTDDYILRWLIKQMMDVMEMGRGKFTHWMEAESVESLDMGLLEWQREWGKLKRKQLAIATGEERAKVALALCRSFGLLRSDVTERNDLGETPLLAAVACGERKVLAPRTASD